MSAVRKKCAMSDSQPFVSVIILSHNGVSYLNDCLRTVIDQDYPQDRYEVILADNGSTDGSQELIRNEYPQVIVLDFGRNHGFARGNNLAKDAARGELLVFLNQDTIVGRTWLRALVEALTIEGYHACSSNILSPRNGEFRGVEARATPTHVYYYELTKFGYADQLIVSFREQVIPTTFISGASFIIRRDIIERVSYLFDETLGTYCEDTELALRLWRAGFRVGAAPRSVVYHFSSFSYSLERHKVWKHFMMIRNRFFAYRKALPPREFIARLPYLAVSHPHKVFKRARSINRGSLESCALATAAAVATLGVFVWFCLAIMWNPDR
jgi:GT2 family glycosyltransferase